MKFPEEIYCKNKQISALFERFKKGQPAAKPFKEVAAFLHR